MCLLLKHAYMSYPKLIIRPLSPIINNNSQSKSGLGSTLSTPYATKGSRLKPVAFCLAIVLV